MKTYVTIRTKHIDNTYTNSKFILNGKWNENTFLEGHRKDDFDWKRNENNNNQFFGVNIYDNSVVAFVNCYTKGV